MKTVWTEERLQQLFARYNNVYWNGRLPIYRVAVADMTDAIGLCNRKQKQITIDVERQKSDQEIRSTLLHEMAHAAAFVHGSHGHDPKFFAQVEKLLRMRAPIAIHTGEAGGARIFANLVPARFPLLKRKIDRLEAKRSKAIENYVAQRNLSWETITREDVLRRFEDAAGELTWKKALIAVGLENGMVDDTGRPLTGSQPLLVKAKRAHSRARRDYLRAEKARKEYLSRLDGERWP